MTCTDMENKSLETVCASKRVRIEAIHKNDADAMNGIIDEKSIHIAGSGKIHDRDLYVKAVRTHELTHSSDPEPIATDHRVDGDLVILVSMANAGSRVQTLGVAVVDVVERADPGGPAA